MVQVESQQNTEYLTDPDKTIAMKSALGVSNMRVFVLPTIYNNYGQARSEITMTSDLAWGKKKNSNRTSNTNTTCKKCLNDTDLSYRQSLTFNFLVLYLIIIQYFWFGPV